MLISCPCFSGLSADDCCAPLLDGVLPAPTALRLMRSRFSAFRLQDNDYLLGSWHGSTRPATLSVDPTTEWLSLEIVGRTGGSLLVNKGTVEFRAGYRTADGSIGEQHENSSFVREAGNWYYLGIA